MLLGIEMSISERFPAVIDKGRECSFSIIEIYSNLNKHRESIKNNDELLTDIANRYVCGYPVPEFQRPLCWTVEQSVAFIESIIIQLSIGTYTVHDSDFTSKGAIKFSGWLIDGQQRLYSLEQYFDSKFPVFGFYWSELTKAEKRKFLNIGFTQYKSALWDEELIRDLYNRLSFGGTAHKDNQRA